VPPVEQHAQLHSPILSPMHEVVAASGGGAASQPHAILERAGGGLGDEGDHPKITARARLSCCRATLGLGRRGQANLGAVPNEGRG
jgi:hypothetical protein